MGRTKQTPVRKKYSPYTAAKRKYSSRQVKLAHANFYSHKMGNPKQRYRFIRRFDRQSAINPTFSDTTQPVISVMGRGRRGSSRSNPIIL